MSIGIIFKNDIRCIERCLKALQPLREAVPCELVMADTGSTDGSREIAEKYADILIDFPWIDDFAAARNAVMDRCSGMWHFTIDTDEYLDGDVSELTEFLRDSDKHQEPLAMVIVRNYTTYDMDGDYSDFSAGRILRMSTGVRYEGAVHEHLNYGGEVVACPLLHTVLHHDGYVEIHNGGEKGLEKTRRNLKMIKKALEKSPDSLLLRMQLIEAGSKSTVPDYEEQLRQAVCMVREKRPGWERLGPPILRYAVYAAENQGMPEWDEWLQMAEEWFPDSMFTRLDVEYAAFAHEWNEGKDREHALRRGERYLKALEDYRNGVDPLAQTHSTLHMASPISECIAKIHIINGYCTCDRITEAFELVKTVDYSRLNADQTGKLVSALQDIHYKSTLDTAPVISEIWDSICDSNKSEEQVNQRKTAVLSTAGRTFIPQNMQAEREKKTFCRNAYSLYTPLQDKCDLGRAAAVMGMADAAEIETVLKTVESWNDFSIYALSHALKCGVHFPLPEKPLNIEEMDKLASRLAKDKETLFDLATQEAEQSDWDDIHRLLWIRGLVMAAVQAYPWDAKEEDDEKGFMIAQVFAHVEEAFLPRCYSHAVLQKDGLFMLPPMHRFGWYCAQALSDLNNGEFASCVKKLRAGLCVYNGAAKMVEFLLERIAEMERNVRIAAAPQELIALADQIKVILARFTPDDPAVIELKRSPEYQQVAWLIEKPAQLVFTNIPQ